MFQRPKFQSQIPQNTDFVKQHIHEMWTCMTGYSRNGVGEPKGLAPPGQIYKLTSFGHMIAECPRAAVYFIPFCMSCRIGAFQMVHL